MTLFLVLNPLISVVLLVAYLFWSQQYTAYQVMAVTAFGFVFAILTNLSITMGYHRLFAHKSYEAHPLLQGILLFISSGAFQGSALKWCSDHRVHHKFEDTDKDPYSINKGFWYAHMGWMMTHEAVSLPVFAPDLEKNKLIKWQHDNYLFAAVFVGYAFPTLVGALMGNALLGLVIAGGLRIFFTQQSTFLVNSLSHTLGKTPYSLDKTAKDSFIVTILTHGEGYHNFHHKFQFDYRNGIRWYHWDPTKWSIQLAALIGLAKKLKTVQFSEILKARLEVESVKFQNTDFYREKLEPLSAKIVEAQAHFEKLKVEYAQTKDQKMEELKQELELMKVELDSMKKKWRILIKSQQPVLVYSR